MNLNTRTAGQIYEVAVTHQAAAELVEVLPLRNY